MEPWAAVDPTDPSHLVSAWQQDRWSNGGAPGLVAGYSFNGGSTWGESPQPFSACYGASHPGDAFLNYQRASDAWVSIGPGNPTGQTGSTVYSVSISFDQTPFGSDTNAADNAVGASVSFDGGRTWTHTQPIIADPCVTPSAGNTGYTCHNNRAYVFNDKESVTADPGKQGVAYAVWDRLLAPPASSTGTQHELAYFGQTFVSKTTDYGRTWSTPTKVLSLGSQDQTIGNQVVIDRSTGALYDFFNLINNQSNPHDHKGNNVAFVKSTDGGATWSKPSVVAAMQSVGVSDPVNLDPRTNAAPAPSRTGDIIPEPAINPLTGQLYVVWQDARFNGHDQATIATSSDSTGFVPVYVATNCADGGPTQQPSCRALTSVLKPTDRTPTENNATDVYAAQVP